MNPPSLTSADALRRQIRDLVQQYHAASFAKTPFVPGQTPVPVSGRVYDAADIQSLVDSSLDFWLTTGRFAEQFEKEFTALFGARAAVLCNSGSSANLLAVCALTSPKLGDRRLKPGDEVITLATGFPTTLNPILQNGLVPVFVDVELGTWNVDVAAMEQAVGPRTRAIVLAHTLGNPFDVGAVAELSRKHNLWIIEDNCDALGARFRGRLTGSFGHLATCSFYPAHHITMGEGGCVVVNESKLKSLVESFRDWGRDCWCDPGKDNTCGKRFQWKLGGLPEGYDHKYVFSHIGYNLKLTDMQAAVGVSQLKKLPAFIEARRRNFDRLYQGLKPLEEYFLLPSATPNTEPSWFGFPLAVRPEAPFTREQLIRHLDQRRIGTRLLFGGNLLRQPAYQGLHHRIAGELKNSDFVMNHVFWVGVYPGLTAEMLDSVIETINQFCSRAKL